MGFRFVRVLPSLYAPSDSSAVLSEAAVSWMDLTHAVSPRTVTAQVLWQGSDTSAEASQKLVASALLSDRLDLTGFFFFFFLKDIIEFSATKGSVCLEKFELIISIQSLSDVDSCRDTSCGFS